MQLYNIHTTGFSWMVAVLLGMLLIISAIQPQTIALSIQTLASPIQRRYSAGNNLPLLIILRAIFQIGAVSLALFVAAASFMGNNTLPNIRQLLYTAGILSIVMLIKRLIDRWIQTTFHFSIQEKTFYAYRGELWLVISMALWVGFLFIPWMGLSGRWIMPVVLFGAYLGILGWKIMQAFGWDLVHLAYMLLYIIHAEALPLFVVAAGIKYLVKN